MITIGMWIGFFIGMYLSNSLIGYTIFGLIGIWCGAAIGVLCSDSRKDTWIINKKEAVRLTLVFVFAFIVRFFAEAFISNHVIVLLIHLAAILIFDSWHRVIKGAVDWQQLVCVGGGVLGGIALAVKCDFPTWLGFFVPIIGAILGSIAYNKFVLPKIKNDGKEIVLGCRLYGILAAIDGGITVEEENYFRSRLSRLLPEKVSGNTVLITEFYNASKNAENWDSEMAEFVRTAYLNQSESIDEYILDICFFALLRNGGEISSRRYVALKKLAEGFDIPIIFMDRLISDLKDQFHGYESQYQERYQNETIDTCFSMLGVDKNASYDEVKRAYRIKSLLNHPDKVRSYGFDEKAVNNANRKMQDINDAYAKIKKYKGWN